MQKKEKTVVLILSLLLTSLIVVDIVTNSNENDFIGAVILEFSILGTALSTSLYLLLSFKKTYSSLNNELKRANKDMVFWKTKSKDLIEGLAISINEQLNTWELTTTEKEIALLLIKGFTTKEIANLRGGAEKTVRVHASSIYKKSKLAGRNELTSYFLEDLLSPV